MRPRAWIAGTDSTVSVSSPFVVTERSHVGSPCVWNPYRFRRRAAASVVTSGTRWSQPSTRDPVEVVTVQVGEQDQVQWWEPVGLQRGLGEPSRPQPLAEVGTLAAVQEVGVGEDGEAAQPQDGGGRADEGQRVHARMATPCRGGATGAPGGLRLITQGVRAPIS